MMVTRKQREEMYESIQKEKKKPKKKPKPIKVYTKGYIQHEVKSLYYKPSAGYVAIAQLSLDDEASHRMVVYDHKKKKDIGYIKDERLLKTLKEYPEHLSYINVPEEHKDSCNCHYCYNDLEEEYVVDLMTYVRITNEESHNIQELSDNKRKLNSFLRKVGLFNESR